MTTASLHIQTTHTIADIGEDTWQRLNGTAPYTSYAWYQFTESAFPGDTPLYIVMFDGDTPIARATLRLTYQEPLPIANKIARNVMESVLRRWPLLICQSPLANASGLYLPDSSLREAALYAITEAAIDAGRKQHMFAALFDYLPQHQIVGTEWPKKFMTMPMEEPNTFLDLTWPDFDTYLASLGKSARKDFKRHRNRAADLGIEVRALPRVPDIDAALTLIRSVEEHHNTPPHPYAQSVLEHSPQVGATWLAAEIDGRLVGCGLLLPDRDALTLTFLGLDYEVQYVYFQLMYAAIHHAIDSGAAVLRGGSGAYDFKRRLGFQVEPPFHIAFFINNSLLRGISRAM